MRRPARLAFWGLAAVTAAVYCSDRLMFRLPAERAAHCDKDLASHARRGGMEACWTFETPAVTEKISRTLLPSGEVPRAVRPQGAGRWFDGRRHRFIVTPFAWTRLGTEYTAACRALLEPGSAEAPVMAGRDGHRTAGFSLRDGRMCWDVPTSRGVASASYPFEHYGRFVSLVGTASLRDHAAVLYEDGREMARVSLPDIRPLDVSVVFGADNWVWVPFPFRGMLREAALWSRVFVPGEAGRLTARSYWPSGPVMLRLKRLFWTAYPRLLDRAGELAGCCNPLWNQHRLLRAGVQVWNLTLSKKDLRWLARCSDRYSRSGVRTGRLCESRTVRLAIGRQERDASLGFRPGPAGVEDPRKPSLLLEFESESGQARQVWLRPPEQSGLLMPLLHARLSGTSDRCGLVLLMVNGAVRGLYAYDASGFGRPTVSSEAAAVARMPVAPALALAQYRELERFWKPLLLCDATRTISRREMAWRLHENLRSLVRRFKDPDLAGDPARAARAAEWLGPEDLLGGNPAADCVTGNLSLPRTLGKDAAVEWTSSAPEILAPDGRVTRPETPAPDLPVTLTAHIRCGAGRAEKNLDFRVAAAHAGIPVMDVRFAWAQMQKLQYQPCGVEVLWPGGGRSGVREGKIRFRGNTCFLDDKKSYSVSTLRPHGWFDFSDPSAFNLMAASEDGSLLKNVLAYGLFRDFGSPGAPRFAPRIRHVELCVNGRYQGIYEASEKVAEFNTGLVAGGVIYKARGNGCNFQKPARDSYLLKLPKYGSLWEPYEALIRFIGHSTPQQFALAARDWMDVDEVMDFQILVNLANSGEGTNHNLYLVRGTGPGSRFFIVPWDFDKAWGNETDKWLGNFLFSRLLNDLPGYPAALSARWAALRAGVLSDGALQARIDAEAALLRGRAGANARRWGRPDADFERDVRSLREWVRRRAEFLDRFMSRFS